MFDGLNSDGDSGFIWSAYGITALVLFGLLLTSLMERGRRRRQLTALETATGGRRRRVRP